MLSTGASYCLSSIFSSLSGDCEAVAPFLDHPVSSMVCGCHVLCLWLSCAILQTLSRCAILRMLLQYCTQLLHLSDVVDAEVGSPTHNSTSQSYLRIVRPYTRPSWLVTSPVESNTPTTCPSGPSKDPPRFSMTSTNSGSGFPGHTVACVTVQMICSIRAGKPLRSLLDRLVRTRLACACHDMSASMV